MCQGHIGYGVANMPEELRKSFKKAKADKKKASKK